MASKRRPAKQNGWCWWGCRIHTLYKFQGAFILDLFWPGPIKWPPLSNWNTFSAFPECIFWFSFIWEESRLSALRHEHSILNYNEEICFKSMLLIWTEALMWTNPERTSRWFVLILRAIYFSNSILALLISLLFFAHSHLSLPSLWLVFQTCNCMLVQPE